MSITETGHAESRSGLLPHEIAFGALLACASGAAVLAHVFGPVPMSFAAPFVVVPASALLVAAVLLLRRFYERLHAFAGLLMLGAGGGLVATLFYDAVRPLLRLAFGYAMDPYRAIGMFGQLITGRPPTDPVALAFGWVYHFWNGISFGMMFALVRPRGGMAAGLLWGLALQSLMMVAYPRLLRIRLDDPGFLTMGLVGHAVWGLVLGAYVRHRGRYA